VSLDVRAGHLFAPLISRQSGRFVLTTPAREIALDLSVGQVLGVDGMPELLSDLAELRGLKLSGNLAKDLNLALTQGVSYETAAQAAATNLGKLLIHQLSHPLGETSFKKAAPSAGAWPLPRTLLDIMREALRTLRTPEDLSRLLGDKMHWEVRRAQVEASPFALDPIALRTLGGVREDITLGELLLHSGRGVPARTRAAWTAIDLLMHLGLVALVDPSNAPARPSAEPEPNPRPLLVEEGEPPRKKPRIKKKRTRRKKPVAAADGERPRKRRRKRPEGEAPPRKKRRRRKKPVADEVVQEVVQEAGLKEYDDLDLSALEEKAAPVITPQEDASVHVVAGPPKRTAEQELWYGIDDLTPDAEDEDDPFGLFDSNPDDSLIEPDPLDLTGEFIWADDDHESEAWATRVAERTVAVPEVTLSQLKHLPNAFRTMNPLEVLGLEMGDTVTVATVREAYEQRFAQFDPEAWQASGDEARSWAAQARAYVSAAFRKVQTAEGVEKYATRWRDDQDTAPNALRADDEDDLDDGMSDSLDEYIEDDDSLDDAYEDDETGDTDLVDF
jgi:hypothetical protein